jgi:hypothetical protein
MSRFRITIAQSLAIVLFVGLACAAMRICNVWTSSAVFTIAVVMVLAAFLGAIGRKGHARMIWAGFGIFGLAYILLGLPEPEPPGTNGLPKRLTQGMLIEQSLTEMLPYIASSTDFIWQLNNEKTVHSLGIITFGFFGAVVGRVLAPKEDRSDPPV